MPKHPNFVSGCRHVCELRSRLGRARETFAAQFHGCARVRVQYICKANDCLWRKADIACG